MVSPISAATNVWLAKAESSHGSLVAATPEEVKDGWSTITMKHERGTARWGITPEAAARFRLWR